MRKFVKIPRILKIEKIDGHKIQCMFNNGESRLLDFKNILDAWNITPNGIEYSLLDVNMFKRVQLRNYTLSWPDIPAELLNENGETEIHPYEIGPDVLFRLSTKANDLSRFQFGNLIKKARIKAGMTQQQLAEKSGTTRFYISKVENNKTDIELSTFRKIVEAGLGQKIKLTIE